jgi:Tat protein secretion system quality control protein TatD with DNase activity
MNRNKLPEVEIELEQGRVRRLCIDYNAMAEMVDLGYSLEEVSMLNLVEEYEASKDTAGNPVKAVRMKRGSLKKIRALVWAGLVTEDSTLTIAQVGKAIGEIGLDYFIDKLRVAFDLILPAKTAEKVEGGEPEAPFVEAAKVD